MDQTLEDISIAKAVESFEDPESLGIGLPKHLWKKMLQRYVEINAWRAIHPDFDPYEKQDLSGCSNEGLAIYEQLKDVTSREEFEKLARSSLSDWDFMDEFSARGPAVSEMNTPEAKQGMMEMVAGDAASALYDRDGIRVAVPFSSKFHLNRNGLMEEFIDYLNTVCMLTRSDRAYLNVPC